jgi:hypothetical protein
VKENKFKNAKIQGILEIFGALWKMKDIIN